MDEEKLRKLVEEIEYCKSQTPAAREQCFTRKFNKRIAIALERKRQYEDAIWSAEDIKVEARKYGIQLQAEEEEKFNIGIEIEQKGVKVEAIQA